MCFPKYSLPYSKQRDTGKAVIEYRFTGQKQDGSGLQYFNARYYDPSLGTFISPDTIVPEPGSAVSYNRFAYANSNPLKFVDPSGHFSQNEIESYLQANYKDHWREYLSAWMSDTVFLGMMLAAQIGDTLFSPTSPALSHGEFTYADNAAFGFFSHQGDELYQYQGYGPYRLTDAHGEDRLHVEKSFSTSAVGYLFSSSPNWQQPLYHYQDGAAPSYSGYDRKVSYNYDGFGLDYTAGDSLPALPEMFVTVIGAVGVAVICGGCEAIATAWGVAGTGTSLNNMFPIYHVLTVDLVDRRTWLSPAPQACNAQACMSQDWSQHPDESDGLLK